MNLLIENKLDKNNYNNLNSSNINNNNNCSNYNSLINKVKCIIHEDKFIDLDTSNYSIFCKKCNNKKNLKFKYLDTNAFSKDSNKQTNYDINKEISKNDIVYCDNHPNELNCSFFCLDCSVFICDKCITGVHRQHNSNIPGELRIFIKDSIIKIDKIIEYITRNINLVNIDFESAHNEISKLKDYNNKRISAIKEIINEFLINLKQDLYKKYTNTVELNHNKETNDYYAKSNSDLYRINDFFKKFEKHLFNINNQLEKYNNQKQYFNKREIKEVILEIKKFQSTVRDIDDRSSVQVKIDENLIKKNYEKLIENKLLINEKAESALNEIDDLFDNINTSLECSYFTKPYFLRRFYDFFDPGVMYFKNSAIYLENLSERNIILSGISLCNLISSKEKSNLAIKISVYSLNKSDLDMLKNSNLLNTNLNSDDININNLFYHSELWKQLYKEDAILKELDANNSVNPTQTFYFNNYTDNAKVSFIKLLPNHKYKIAIENTNDSYYVRLYNGKVRREEYESMYKEKKTTYLTQTITCNNTNIDFKISSSLNSDFNEFSNGIICDIIYSLI